MQCVLFISWLRDWILPCSSASCFYLWNWIGKRNENIKSCYSSQDSNRSENHLTCKFVLCLQTSRHLCGLWAIEFDYASRNTKKKNLNITGGGLNITDHVPFVLFNWQNQPISGDMGTESSDKPTPVYALDDTVKEPRNSTDMTNLKFDLSLEVIITS